MNLVTKKQIGRIPSRELKDKIERGIFDVVNTTNKPPSALAYTDYPQYKKHAKWKGLKISTNAASREFEIPQQTLSRWAARGLITVLERTNREVYLDKADVAYCAEIYRERQGAGKWLFNPDRTPYVPLTRQTL